MGLPFDYQCEWDGCKTNLTFGIFKYSISSFKKALCIKHQKEERLKTMPRSMAELINRGVTSTRQDTKEET